MPMLNNPMIGLDERNPTKPGVASFAISPVLETLAVAESVLLGSARIVARMSRHEDGSSWCWLVGQTIIELADGPSWRDQQGVVVGVQIRADRPVDVAWRDARDQFIASFGPLLPARTGGLH